MPPFIRTQCPKCGHTFTKDLAELRDAPLTVYRGLSDAGDEPHEYLLVCPKCGHKFKIVYPPPESEV